MKFFLVIKNRALGTADLQTFDGQGAAAGAYIDALASRDEDLHQITLTNESFLAATLASE